MLNLKRANYIAIDTETTGLNPWGNSKRWGFYPARPFAFSFYDDLGNKEYHRWQVDPFTRRVIPEYFSRKRIQKILSSNQEKVFFNANFDLRMLEFSGFKIWGKVHDVLVMMHVATGGSEMSYGLKPLAKKFAGISDQDEEDLLESVRKGRRFGRKNKWCLAEELPADYWTADPKLCRRYAIRDAKRTIVLFLTAKEELEKNPSLVRVYRREMFLQPVVRNMEDRGTCVFPETITSLRKFYHKYKEEQILISKKNGCPDLNFRSPKQLIEVFYKKRKHAILDFTKKGNPKIDGTVLERLANKDPLARAVLEYRAADHVITGFLDPYDAFKVQEPEGHWILHPNFQQAGPSTGRFRCSDPNLMQVAAKEGPRKKSKIELRPRECFGPREGFLWYLPDYSQIEVWIFAYISKDKGMIDALLSGEDFHMAIARKVWGHKKDFKEKASTYRGRAKLIMFCKLYGGGVGKVAFLIGCSYDEAETFVAEYDATLPGVKPFMKRVINQTVEEGIAQNVYGRIYNVDREVAYRAVNYLVQGAAADVMKLAMIRVQYILEQKWPGANILLTLHDELIIESPLKYHGKEIMTDIIKAMQKGHSKVLGIPVPLPVDMAVSKDRWHNAVDLCRKHLKENCSLCEK